ncbi:hypothetical protein JCR33_12630 [Acuticoccus sp. 2012]|uniref:Uncharacterized protein n=2 Tax=Acuticoccus mangrovi TaxID=2796142 RepID=A0A934IRX1_9HYPH|nr:hypothetical protein [Acuticoccus mangrovi]
MKPSDEGHENDMGKGADMPTRRRGAKPPRAEALSELTMIAAFLVAAVVVAAMVAGGPVLEMIAGLDIAWAR